MRIVTWFAIVFGVMVQSAAAQGSWVTAAPMPTRRADLAVVTGADGRIYAINGRTANGSPSIALRLMEIYDPLANSWSTGTAPMDGHYGGRAALGHNGLIYLMGGYYEDSTVEAYNPVTATWATRASMITGRFGFAAVTGNDGLIYTFGGDTSGGGQNVNVVEVYNPATDSWASLPPIPEVRSGLGAAVGPDGRIYLIGGGSSGTYLSVVDVYNPATNSWSTAAPLPTPRSNLAVVAGSGGVIYAIGGQSANGILNTVEAYNPSSNTWQTMAAMPTARITLGAASAAGRIFAIGGIDAAGDFGIATNEAFTPSMTVGGPPSFGPQVYAGVAATGETTIVDFDHDGIPDLLSINYQNNIIFQKGNGDGTFQNSVVYSMSSLTGAAPDSFAIADFNKDGNLDLVVVHGSSTGNPNGFGNSVTVHLGDGHGGFLAGLVFTTGGSDTDVVAGDFNEDGIPDIAIVSQDDASTFVYFGNGDGTFSSGPVLSSGGGPPGQIKMADFNNDGHQDLVTVQYTATSLTVWLGDGSGNFTSASNIAVPFATNLAVGDFNQDGKPDVAITDYYGSQVIVFAGDGTGHLLQGGSFAVGAGPTSITVADFNRDGILDIGTVSYTAGLVSILTGLGNGQFSRTDLTVQPAVLLTAGDLNGDMLPDLVLTSNPGGTSILLNTTNHNPVLIPPTVTFTGAPASAVFGSTFTVSATTNASTAAMISASGACSVSGNIVTMSSGTGACQLMANWAADSIYAAASAAQSTAAIRAMPTITWSNPASINYGTALSFAQLNALASVPGTYVYSPAAGTVLLAGSQPLAVAFTPSDTMDYTGATGSAFIIVLQAPQTVTFTVVPPQTVGSTVTLSATASSGGSVTFSSSTPAVCSVSGNTLSLIAGGMCSVTATQAGNNTMYSPASATQTFMVNLKSQTISFSGLPASAVYGSAGPYALSGTASSGLPVSYSVTGPASVSGSSLSITGAGTVMVTAAQSGNSIYAPAVAVTQSIVVALAPTTTLLTAASTAPPLGQPDLLTAAVSGAGQATGNVVFSAGASTICTSTLSGGVATCSYTASGSSVTITAQYQGDANHQASSATLTLHPVEGAVQLTVLSSNLVYPGATNVTVCVTPATKATATGTVQIYDGTTYLTTAPLQGAGCAYWYISPGLVVGTHPFTAVYSGDSNNKPGTSAIVTLTVIPVPTNLAVSCWNSTFAYGGNYNCAINVSSNANSPLGYVTYTLDGGSPVNLPLSNGGVALTLTKPQPGTHTVVFHYPLQGNYAASGTNTQTFKVTGTESWAQ